MIPDQDYLEDPTTQIADDLMSLNTQDSTFSQAEDQYSQSSTSYYSQDEYDSDITDTDEGSELPNQADSEIVNCACSYCGLNNPSCAVKCEICKKWFCNSKGQTTSSHIINHLVRSKHKEISLHSSNPLEDSVLECYNCGCKNIFLLGFVSAKESDVAVLLCREPCLHDNSLGNDWKVNEWTPLIKERALLDWLVKTPTAKEAEQTKQVNQEYIHKLEDLWKQDPNARFIDSETVNGEDNIQPIQFQYQYASQYISTMSSLINLEELYDKKMKECQTKYNVSVRWESSINNKPVACFYFGKDDSELRLVPGDELRMSLPGKYPGEHEWVNSGHITKILFEEIFVEFKNMRLCPTNITTGYTVEFIWKPTTFKRMRVAMDMFSQEGSISPVLYNKILGQNIHDNTSISKSIIPKRYSAPNLPELNHSQVNAVKAVLQKPLSLIQGPPGTGKTVTSSTIVYHMAKSNYGKVLVCAPSNVAVDQLSEKIHQTGLTVVRICAKSRESVDSSVSFLALHKQARMVKGTDKYSKLFLSLSMKKEENGELNEEDEKQYNIAKYHVERKILKSADVICTTCVGAGDYRLKRFKFPYVLIDESTQAMEPECIIPMVKGAKQVVLVGDHCQLGPVIMCKKAAKAGLSRSLFERLVMLGIRPIRLQVQYRMHPCLSEFPSNTFYEGTLQNGVTESDHISSDVGFPWPVPRKPMFFYNSIGDEEISVSGTSYLNRAEATMVEAIVTLLLKKGVKPPQLGVVTPYEGQRSFIANYMQRVGPLNSDLYNNIEVSSIDAFQGREKDYIILSCVRSNEKLGIGFLNDPRRLNVALTRARCGLIIIGNANLLSGQPLWNHLLVHFKKQGCVVEGPLSNLKQTKTRFQKPKKFYNSRFAIGYGLTPSIPFGQNIPHYGQMLQDGTSIRPEMPDSFDPSITPAQSFLTAQEQIITSTRHSGYLYSENDDISSQM